MKINYVPSRLNEAEHNYLHDEEQIPLPHFSRIVEDDPYGAGQGQGPTVLFSVL
jgi:hypothetical protein